MRLGVRSLHLLVFPAFVILACAAPGKATEDPALGARGVPRAGLLQNVTLSAETDFLSRYVWRGLASSRGFVWQPSVTASTGSFRFSLWGNFPLDHEPNQFEFNEIDLVLSYNPRIRDFLLTFLLRGELFPNATLASRNYGTPELVTYFRAAHPLGPVTVASALAINQVAVGGALYGTFEVSHERRLGSGWELNTTFLGAYGNRRFNKTFITDAGARLHQLQLSLTFPWHAWRGLTISPTINVSALLPHSFREAALDPTLVWGGVMVRYDF